MEKAGSVKKHAGIRRLLLILCLLCAFAIPAKPVEASLGVAGWLLSWLNPCKTPPPEEVRKEYEGVCWFCKPFLLMATAIGTTTVSTYQYTRTGSIKILGIAFALWLAFVTAVYIFKSAKGGEYIKKISEQTLRVVVAVALLSMAGLDMISLILTPIVDIILSYGGETLKTSAAVNTGITVLDGIVNALMPMDGETVGENSPIGNINKNLMGIYAYAVVIWRYSFEFGDGCIIPLLELFLTACGIGVGAIILLLLIPLKIIDSLFRIGVVIILMPLLIAAWAFPITRKYTKTGWNVFLSALLFIFFLSVTLIIIRSVIDIAMQPYLQGLSDGDKITVYVLRARFSIISLNFLILVGVFLFSVKMIGVAGELAKEFGSAEGTGNMATSAATTTMGLAAVGAGAAAYVAVKQRKNIYHGAKWTAKKGYGATKWGYGKLTGK